MARAGRIDMAPLRRWDRPISATVDAQGRALIDDDLWVVVDDVALLRRLLATWGEPTQARREAVLLALQLRGYWPTWQAINAHMERL